MKFRYDTLKEELGMIEKYSKFKREPIHCTDKITDMMTKTGDKPSSYGNESPGGSNNFFSEGGLGVIPGVAMFVEKVNKLGIKYRKDRST